MHGRSLPIDAAPARVRQWLILHDDDAPLDTWLSDKFGASEATDMRHIVGHADDCDIIWERHNEFSTITAIRAPGQVRNAITSISWLRGLPGKIFRSVEILVGRKGDFDWDTEAVFNPARLVSSLVFDGAARIWSDFTITANGGGRILVEDLGLQNDEVARLVQTLIEIGNYRKLALLGFPLARELMPWVTDVEARHSAITERHHSGEADSNGILSDLSALSSQVELRASRARFRLGATNSYHLLTTDRLRALRETRIAGFSTTAEFVERRLLPAMRTCEIAQRRIETICELTNRTARLLSLEQTIQINRQNQAILGSLNRRAAMQLRLQNLVEGFSIFAISYYIINILEYVLKTASAWAGVGGIDHLAGILVVPVLLATWKTLQLSKRRQRPGLASTGLEN